ncbi:MAG: DnaD domain protein, partial [Oscillospiraceae bacterium]|nr:DnaD domain protein [Oscillospiraceae bacterium]
HFYPKEIARAVREDKGMDFLFRECERIYGRTLKHSEQNALMLMTEETGIPAECTLMLVEFCFSVGKPTPAYMKKIAADWLERDIMNINAVEEEIKILREINSLENRLKRLFEMNSAFSKTQKDFIRKWSSLGYDEDMLNEAYQITLDKAGKMAFPYMDKIIEGWNAEGIKDKQALENSQKKHKEKTRREQSTGSSFDIDKISKLINER